VLSRDLGRLRAPRIDHEDLCASRLDLLEAPNRIRDLKEAPLGDRRVGTHDDQALEVVEVWERLREREAVDVVCDGELVGAVLRGRCKHTGRADALHEALREYRMEHAKPGRRTDVHRDTVRPVAVDELTDLSSDARESRVPAHALKLTVDALEWVEQSIGRAEHLVLLEPLEASVPTRGDVLLVGFDVDDLVALDRDLETAKRLANPAKRLHRLRHG
jgi:hypothetical protein